MVLEEFHCFLYAHVENVADVLALVAHLECFAVIALALADLARNVDVREEVHFDFYDTVALTRLASAALDVEREAALSIAAHFCVVGGCEQRADIGKQARVGRRI